MSNDNGRVKTYKNKERSHETVVKPYVPQYITHGVEPQEYKGAILSGTVPTVKPQPLPSDNPRARRPAIRQPYAAVIPSPVGRGRGPVPNVGNNMEHTWSSVDGEIVDDLEGAIDAGQAMIDNNDYMTDQALGLPAGTVRAKVHVNPEPAPFQAPGEFEQVTSQDDLLSIVNDLEEGAYLLVVDNVPVCSGPLEEIQDQAKAMVYGEHEVCDGNPVPVDDIIILKRVKVKVGLFLE